VVLRTATVTKLTRNLFLAGVIPLLSWWHARESGARPGAIASGARTAHWTRHIPGFVVGFLLMAGLRSAGDYSLGATGAALGLFDAAGWSRATAMVGDVWASRWLLGTAMAAVGLNTSLTVFRGVGLRPFVVGLVGALMVGLVGLLSAVVFGQFVHL
jgi:uncharacterized membrane protein YadS